MSDVAVTLHTKQIERVGEYESSYGLQFVEADPAMLAQFQERLAALGATNRAAEVLLEEVGGLAARAVELTVPTCFLNQPLNDEQKRLVNEYETDEVAAISVNMQDGLLQVPVEESFEPMRALGLAFGLHGVEASFSEAPFHPACGDWAGRERQFYVRESFAKRLVLLGALLDNADVYIHFEDAFRPVGVQEGLFRRRVEWTRRDHPDWEDERVITEARSKTAVTPRLASHKGGAAVDLTLRSSATNEPLDIGHEYPEGGALVYRDSPFVTQEQWMNRQLLLAGSKLAGLAMYVGEDWHLSYGDNLAALDANLVPRPGYVAKYGPVKSFHHQTGEIQAVYSGEELDAVFEM